MTFAIPQYRTAKEIVLGRNRSVHISLIHFVPRDASGFEPFIADLDEPIQFLLWLVAEQLFTAASTEPVLGPRLLLEGFLGSGGHAVDPLLLVPVTGLWIGTVEEVPFVVRQFEQRVEEADSRALIPQAHRMHIPTAEDLVAFVRNGIPPRPEVVDAFSAGVRTALLGRQPNVR